jgi:hypothetical protein
MLRGFKEYSEFVYGGLLLLVLIAMPQGLVGLAPRLWSLIKPGRADPAPPASAERAA